MPAVNIAPTLRGNDPAALAVTPGVSGVRIRGTTVVTEAGTPVVLTKNPKRQMRWRQASRDARALIKAGSMALTADVPTITTVLPATADNDDTTVVTITGTGFEVGADVLIGDAPAGNVIRVSATSITFTVPTDVEAGIYDITVTDGDLNVTAEAALTVTETP